MRLLLQISRLIHHQILLGARAYHPQTRGQTRAHHLPPLRLPLRCLHRRPFPRPPSLNPEWCRVRRPPPGLGQQRVRQQHPATFFYGCSLQRPQGQIWKIGWIMRWQNSRGTGSWVTRIQYRDSLSSPVLWANWIRKLQKFAEPGGQDRCVPMAGPEPRGRFNSSHPIHHH
ncbi:hypothetical protein ACFX2C_043305 [Malus domestica]